MAVKGIAPRPGMQKVDNAAANQAADATRTAEMSAKQAQFQAQKASIDGASFTSYKDPTTGVYYEYGGGGPAGKKAGAGAGAGGDDGSGDINLQELWSQTGGLAGPPPLPQPARVAPPNPADRSAAEAAVYGRAKDKVGLETRASMNALGSEMGARNLSDSSFTGAAASGILQRGQMELGDTNRSQAIDALKRAGEVEDRNYAGDVGQRGQDVSYVNNVNDHNLRNDSARRALLDRLITIRRSGGRIY